LLCLSIGWTPDRGSALATSRRLSMPRVLRWPV